MKSAKEEEAHGRKERLVFSIVQTCDQYHPLIGPYLRDEILADGHIDADVTTVIWNQMSWFE